MQKIMLVSLNARFYSNIDLICPAIIHYFDFTPFRSDVSIDDEKGHHPKTEPSVFDEDKDEDKDLAI